MFKRANIKLSFLWLRYKEYILKKIAVFLFFLSLTACASIPLESLYTEIKTDEWVVAFEKDFGMGNGYIREFVRKGESAFEWSELISIEFIEGEKGSPLSYINTFKTERKKLCPGTNFEVIEQNQYSVVYLFNFPACQGQNVQSEISKLYKGNDGLHRLSYATKSAVLTDSIKERWLSEFGKAYIVKGRNNVPIQIVDN